MWNFVYEIFNYSNFRSKFYCGMLQILSSSSILVCVVLYIFYFYQHCTFIVISAYEITYRQNKISVFESHLKKKKEKEVR